MKIEYYLDNQYYSLELGKKNLFLNGIGQGKTKLAETYFEGFSAKGSIDFIVNGVNVDKTMFNVLYIDEKFDFDEYLKFKVRGLMFKDFKNNVLEDYEEDLNQFLLKVNEEINKKDFNSYYDTLNNSLIGNKVMLNSGISSIDDVYDKLFSLTFNTEFLSYNEKLEIVIKHMLLFRDKSKMNVVIVDDYIIRFGKEILESILDSISELDNICVIFTSSVGINLKNFDRIFLDKLDKINLTLLYKKMFLYQQWDKTGDFNAYYDRHINLVESEDLVKYEKLICKFEMFFYNICNIDTFFKRALELLN